jgi:hypothetical protein
MTVKVISGNVIHNGEGIGIGGVITDIDRENAERLCNEGLCEILSDVEVGGGISEAERHEEEKDLEKMTKAELIKYAESIGVYVDSKATKAEIISEIESADAPNTEFPH